MVGVRDTGGKQTPFGLWRIAAVVVPFLYVGTRISKHFAELLEEHDIFVPEDDDDDVWWAPPRDNREQNHRGQVGAAFNGIPEI